MVDSAADLVRVLGGVEGDSDTDGTLTDDSLRGLPERDVEGDDNDILVANSFFETDVGPLRSLLYSNTVNTRLMLCSSS
jgi:hypothetical protein